jgi:hypothetical protein
MRKIVLLVLCPSVAACGMPTWAPPLRSTHFGAPGMIQPGQGAVQGVLGAGMAVRGGAMVSFPVSQRVHLEVGGDGMSEAALGALGVRYSHRTRWLLMDVEAGGGVGAGGVLCNNSAETHRVCTESQRDPGTTRITDTTLYPDGLTAWQRFAFGAYAGTAFGIRPWPWMEIYIRGRIQATQATHVSTTLWMSALLGAQFRIGPVFAHAALGWAGYFNERDERNDAIGEIGIMVPFRVFAP